MRLLVTLHSKLAHGSGGEQEAFARARESLLAALGLEVELEHGAHDAETDVTHDDPILTARIAWAHLKELPDYYTRLAVMEAEAEA